MVLYRARLMVIHFYDKNHLKHHQHLSARLSIRPSVHLSVSPSDRPFDPPSLHSSIHSSVQIIVLDGWAGWAVLRQSENLRRQEKNSRNDHQLSNNMSRCLLHPNPPYHRTPCLAGQLGLRPGQLCLRPDWVGLRTGCLGWLASWSSDKHVQTNVA